MGYKQSYKEKQELEKSQKLETGLISERYAGVSRIVFQMTYYQAALNRVLMTRTLNFFPASYAYFHIDCTREDCVDGGFDLAPVVADMVKNRKKSLKGTIFCHGKKQSSGDANAGSHASICYEVKIEYKPV